MEKNRFTEELHNQEELLSPEDDGKDSIKNADDVSAGSDPPLPRRGSKEEAYEWLYRHHVTVRIMNVVIAVCIILLIIVVLLGMNK